MAQIWGLSGIISHKKIKITRVTILRALMEKADNIQEHIGNVSIYNSNEKLKENARNQKNYNN